MVDIPEISRDKLFSLSSIAVVSSHSSSSSSPSSSCIVSSATGTGFLDLKNLEVVLFGNLDVSAPSVDLENLVLIKQLC